MEDQFTPDVVPQQRRRTGRVTAMLRAIVVLAFLGLLGYMLWLGRWFALVAGILLVIFLLDNSVNILFGFYQVEEARRNGLMFWVASIFLGAQGAVLVRPGSEPIPVRPRQPLANIFARLGAPGIIIVENGSAVILERSGRFTRAHGPGIVFTRRFERIARVIDLRPQVRTKRVDNVMTRDGLSFDLDRLDAMFDLAADFDAGQGRYAFSEEALQDLVFRGGLIYYENGQEVEWGTRVLGMVEVFLRDVAASRDLLEIVRSDNISPRERFVREVEDRARPALRQIGIRLSGIDIGHITGPEELSAMLSTILVMPYREQAMRSISEGLRRAIDEVNQAMQRDPSEVRPHLLVNLTEALGHLLEDTLRLTGPKSHPNSRPLLSSGERTKEEEP
jgi:regulator of protease activity HflC (stomatin/prohibitin superfamily)